MSVGPADPDKVARRRAVGVLVLGALIPGSIQRMAGNQRVGSIILRCWLCLIGLVVLMGLGLWLARGFTVGLLLEPWVATTLRILVWLVFIGWVAQLVDAWRLSRPMTMPRTTRLAMTITVAVLSILMGLVTTQVAGVFQAAGNVGTVLPGGGDTERKAGRYNVLLLGTDSSAEREGLRPDSINVASVDAETGRSVIFGLPRNMQRVPFPKSSPLHEEFPDGFHCPDNECMLNAVWTAAEERKDKFPQGANPGLETTKGVVQEVLGLELNYYAIVDMHGFSSIIDAVGGIRLDVMRRIPIGGGGSPVSGYIEPGRNVLLDGRHALWFARSRHDSSDYDRMQRQKCVMAAMVNQLNPQTVATRFVELSEAGKDLLQTDVPRDQIVDLAELALKVRKHDIVSVNFVPPLVPHTSDPDFGMIRTKVQTTITQLEKADEAAGKGGSEAKPKASASAGPKPSPTAGPSGSSSEANAGNAPAQTRSPKEGAETSEDLGVVCKAA